MPCSSPSASKPQTGPIRSPTASPRSRRAAAAFHHRAFGSETFDVVELDQPDPAIHDQLRTSGIEIIPAAALLVHDLPAGVLRPEVQPEAAPLQPLQQLAVGFAVHYRDALVRAPVDWERKRRRQQIEVLERHVLVV